MKISSDPDFKINKVSNETVEKATGKPWPEWVTILNKADAQKMSHKDIAQYLYDHHIKDGWWAQMVSVGYEQVAGLRKPHQKLDGYSVSASKTMPVALSKLYDAWADEKKRQAWLKEKVDVSSQTENKYFNAAWDDGKTRITVGFYTKGDNKSQVALEHSKLSDEKAVESFRTFWKQKLDDLETYLTK